jgi:hypothetical protein
VAQTEQAAHLAWEPEPADLEEVLRVHARLSRWSGWDAVVETDRLYLLRVATGPPRLLPLPKRGARDAVDAARVRAVLTAELGAPVAATGGRRRRRTAR